MSNPGSGYNSPKVIPLRGGLDLQAARFFVTPGTLRDCLNYETYGVAGYAVMDGLEPYDGTIPCFTRDWIVTEGVEWTGSLMVGENLSRSDGKVFGKAIQSGSLSDPTRTASFLVTDKNYYPKVGDTILGAESGAFVNVTQGCLKRASVSYGDMQSFLDARESNYNVVSADKQTIFPYVSYSQNVIPHGLHWFEGKLYATVDHYKVDFDTGNVQIFPGDVLVFFDSKRAIVLDIQTTDGSWSVGNASGSILVKFTEDSNATNSTVTGLVALVRPSGATSTTVVDGVINATSVQSTNAWGAGMYYTNYDDDVISAVDTQMIGDFNTGNRRWFPMEMGWKIDFLTDSGCTATAIPTIQRGSTSTAIYGALTSTTAIPTSQTLSSLSGYSITNPLGPNSVTNPAATALSSILGDNSDLTYVAYKANASIGSRVGTSGKASINGFDLSAIPDKSIITGVSVTTRLMRDSTPVTAGQYVAVNLELTGTKLGLLGTSTAKTVTYSNTITGTPQEDVSGSSSDLWGFEGTDSNLLIAALQDSSFGVRLSLTDNMTDAANLRALLYACTITVYYRVPIEKTYAHDPVSGQDLEVHIPYYFLEKGQLNPGADPNLAGQGTMVIYGITPLNTGGGAPATSLQSILKGWELWSGRNGTGTRYVKFAGNMVSQMLPTRKAMEDSRKQFVVFNGNYYAETQYNAFYGASGLSPAFQYDGDYFFFFRTELDKEQDVPAHAIYFRNHLCLGYDTGSVIVSLPGEPTNFNSVLGSTKYETGDPITNLLVLNGASLGIFCQTSIHTLSGDILIATDDNNAVMAVISPYSGALPYTVVDCGTPIFADFKGISSITTTANYGDFDNGRISASIQPIISTRINDRYAFQATNQNVRFAKPIKNKNQARFYCEDGLIITCTLPTGERGYEFTTQQYVFSSNLDSLVPVAMCTGVTKQGVDVIFGSFKIVRDDTSNIDTPNEPQRECYVYSVDRGTKFFNSPIKHYAQVNFMSMDEPGDFDMIRNIRIESLTYNYYNGYIKVAGDYQKFNENKLPLVIDASTAEVRVAKDSSYLVAKLNGRGTTIAVEFGGEHIYPGHVLQAMLAESMSGRSQQGNSPVQGTN